MKVVVPLTMKIAAVALYIEPAQVLRRLRTGATQPTEDFDVAGPGAWRAEETTHSIGRRFLCTGPGLEVTANPISGLHERRLPTGRNVSEYCGEHLRNNRR